MKVVKKKNIITYMAQYKYNGHSHKEGPMKSQVTYEIYNSIIQTAMNLDITNQKYIEAVKKHLATEGFREHINAMVIAGDYSCKSTLRMLQPLMEELIEDTPPKDWMTYLYQYVLSKTFPNAVTAELLSNLEFVCDMYLFILRIISEYQKLSKDNTWQSNYPIRFLSYEEESALENPAEYKKFIKAFRNEFVYEMMKMNQEIMGYNTLDHICGVHHIAMLIGRQLKKAGLPVDLGRVSGAAIGHDIGKYGCKVYELKRVPYLHYFYSDQWFIKHDIPYIGHIAVNHSTWDLELENLPLESLILIYADFRVKNKVDEDNKSIMHIYSLKDSFDVILNKLDNLDAAKEKRYRRVYAKLKDFEDYMADIRISVEPDADPQKPSNTEGTVKHHYALMQGEEIINHIKYLSINHNINLMYELRDESSLNAILELARSERDWKRLREYIRIFEEYSTYMTQKQKLITLKFCYDQLIHPEGDIRKQSAQLIGELVAKFDEDYRKEVPEDVILSTPTSSSADLLDKYLVLFIYPDHRIIPLHRTWIGHNISIMISSLFTHCRKNLVNSYRKIILKYYKEDVFKNSETRLFLLEALKNIPFEEEDEDIGIVYDYVLTMLKKKNMNLRLSALETSIRLLHKHENSRIFKERLKEEYFEGLEASELPSENFLILKLGALLKLDIPALEALQTACRKDLKRIPDIFLSNLKTATDWVIKRIQIEFLLEYAINSIESNGFYTAMHFCNLLKVSAVESVRNRAGEALIRLIPHLSLEQRNDVAIELIRALEIDGYQFAEYIPSYLGRLILFLHPVELNELIDDFYEKIKKSEIQLSSLILKTVGIAIANYHKYKEGFEETEAASESRFIKMIGIILNGLVNYNLHVKQVSFSVLGREIFGTKRLDLEQKNYIFQLTAKKVLTLLTDNRQEELLFLTNSAGLNHIYRFISDYMYFKGSIELKSSDRVAFFPGTFDPFSLSHKEICKAIRDLGFEVYLSVDEFSWSKRTLPNLLRKNTINMSIADELNIYVYPEEYPTNIANPEDLRILRNNFPKSDVHIVVGSDVLVNASSYQQQKVHDSILTFSHIIFERKSSLSANNTERNIEDVVNSIDGKIIRLTLDPQYEDISSSQIRSYIDEDRDISMLVDPLVQKYIYENGFYKSEPQFKSLIQTMSIDIELHESMDSKLIDELVLVTPSYKEDVAAKLDLFLSKPSSRIILIRDINNNRRIIGFSAFHRVHSSMLYEEFKDVKTTRFIRSNVIGKMLVLDGIFVCCSSKLQNLEQILLSETLALALSKDYDYAIWSSMVEEASTKSLYEILELQGFEQIPSDNESKSVYGVNMTYPCTLNLDIETVIKEPFRSNKNVSKAITKSRKRLQKALTKLYPGHLVLSFDRDILYESLIKKICAENNVSTTTIVPRQLGPAMCVPYGDILNKSIVPNTVTKALHTEKLFTPDMTTYKVGPFPYYLDLHTQLKMLHSFNRPIILVDDILDKGYRIKVLDSLIKRENLKVQKIIVGILSGRGKELMEIQNREVDSAYFIPKLKEWFNEKSFYPFMGGDALWRGVYPERNLLPSINMILPYTAPNFLRRASKEAIYNLSEVSLENAIDLMTTLENEYEVLYERSLTLTLMGHVFLTPRCPDHGKNMNFDYNLSPSHYLKNDLELLKRLKNAII